MVKTAWGRGPIQVLQTWGSKDLPVENKAGWDGGLGFLDQIQFPVIWPWFSYANSLSFCSFPLWPAPCEEGERRQPSVPQPHCTALKAFSLTTFVCCVWMVLKSAYISIFARETMLSKSNLGSCWPQSRPLAAQQLFENFWSKTAWWIDFSGFFFNEDGGRLTASEQCPVWNWHILLETLYFKSISIWSSAKRYIFLSFLSSWEVRCTKLNTYIQKLHIC